MHSGLPSSPSTAPGEQELLTVRETARRLGVHENTVRHWVRRGILRSARVAGGRANRFDAAEVERLARSRGMVVRPIDEGRRIAGPELIDAAQLIAFADRLESQGLLPRLVRRLLAANPDVRELSMPAGDGIASPGWDGRAAARSASPWVPAGRSGWELSSTRNPRVKARADYEKRTAETAAAERAQTTFVFVTPRRWREARDWESTARARGEWRDVRVLNADDLEAWLEATPAVHFWISEQLGGRPEGARTIESWWAQFVSGTRPQLPEELFLAGRERAAEQVRAALAAGPAAIGVQAPWRNDALAFVAALLEREGAELGLHERPALVVSDGQVWHRLAQSASPMTLIPVLQGPDIASALRVGHRVIVPLGAQQIPRGTVIALPRPAFEAVQEGFARAPGVSLEYSYRLARLARRSMAALVRELSVDPGTAKPAWAQRPTADVIAPLALAGSWAETERDHAVLEQLTGVRWPEIERELVNQSAGEDPPFVQAGGQWHVSSPEEAFVVLQPLLTPTLLERWEQITLEVLAQLEPTLQGGTEQRLLAGLERRRTACSSLLREGLAQTLAIMGSVGGEAPRDPLPQRVRGVVRRLLASTNDDETGLAWRSLWVLLPRLAEAAPDEFLDAIEQAAAGGSPLIATMFTDSEQGAGLYASSPHTGLLWALEVLAWSETHLERAAAALARLSEIDPGGRLANRPSASLRAIFLPWRPNTSAGVEQRLGLLDRLAGRHSAVVWGLLLALLPRQHDTSSPTSLPRFRDWCVEREGIPVAEFAAAVAGVLERAIDHAGTDLARWGELASHLTGLSPAHQNEVLARLEQVVSEPDRLDDDARLALWEQLSALAKRHRAFPSADWAMAEDTLSRLEGLASRVEPRATVERHAWLFDWHPDLDGVKRSNHAAYEAALRSARIAAVSETLALDGPPGLLRLAAVAKLPEAVGSSVAQLGDDSWEAEIYGWLDEQGPTQQLAFGCIRESAHARGGAWIESAWHHMASASPDAQALFLRALPVTDELWQALERADPEARRTYWSRVEPWAFASGDPKPAIDQLLGHGRPWDAVRLLALHVQGDALAPSVDAELIRRVLEQALSEGQLEPSRLHMIGYEVGLLLDSLEAAGVAQGEMAKLELRCFALTDQYREPGALYAELASEPREFVELVTAAFRGDDESARKLDEGAATLARLAWEVLRSWRRIPGRMDDGSVDAEHLRTWVEEARLRLSERDRADIGDDQIGQLLSSSPEGSDGLWPAEPVRELIERVGSHALETGFHVGRLNARGVTSRGVFDGGELERELAARYREWAAKMGIEWPRTARVLRGLAESYEREAREHDADAERHSNLG